MTRSEYRSMVQRAIALYKRGAMTKEDVEMLSRAYQIKRQGLRVVESDDLMRRSDLRRRS